MVKLNMSFPEGFFDGEEREGHYITPEMKKVWAVIFDLLNEFMRVCSKHNLRWWADAGTLLGAVRHKGMIPWDDDVDVMLMREDHEKLCKIAPSEFKHPYFFQTEETDNGSGRCLAQLRNSETTAILTSEIKSKYKFNQGIFLDIFPLDNIPDDDKLFALQAKKIEEYSQKLSLYKYWTCRYRFSDSGISFRNLKDYFQHLLATGPLKHRYDYTVPYNNFQIECKKYNNIPTRRICKLVMGHQARRIWQKSWFDETVYLPFEWFELPAPKDYLKLLDRFYGDWHVIKKGTSTHGSVLFDTEKPYTEYIK